MAFESNATLSSSPLHVTESSSRSTSYAETLSATLLRRAGIGVETSVKVGLTNAETL